MALNQEFLNILCCPKCKGSLLYNEKENKLLCNECRLFYMVQEDIPILLVDEANPFEE
ncbi:MAG TPA: Trm112 family protein [Nitrospirae bacterium]|nr:Trm112 family protein [Nitrospirota bacterium]